MQLIIKLMTKYPESSIMVGTLGLISQYFDIVAPYVKALIGLSTLIILVMTITIKSKQFWRRVKEIYKEWS